MAHKGLIAPVAFRRDFNLNVDNNNDGWSRRAIVHLAPCGTTGFAAFWDNTTWDCGPDKLTLIDQLTWESERVLKFGLHWYVQFEIRIANGVNYNRWIRLWTLEFGMIMEITYGRIDFPRYGPLTFEDRAITGWDPGFYDGFPVGLLESTFRKKFWRDGPPH